MKSYNQQAHCYFTVYTDVHMRIIKHNVETVQKYNTNSCSIFNCIKMTQTKKTAFFHYVTIQPYQKLLVKSFLPQNIKHCKSYKWCINWKYETLIELINIHKLKSSEILSVRTSFLKNKVTQLYWTVFHFVPTNHHFMYHSMKTFHATNGIFTLKFWDMKSQYLTFSIGLFPQKDIT